MSETIQQRQERIKHNQRIIGVEDDGFWGEISTEACKVFLRSLMPKPNPWPKTDQASLTAFYGRPGDESKLIRVPAPVRMLYEGRLIETIYCHNKVAASLVRALKDAGDEAPQVVEAAADYSGVYNNRTMRGGLLPSLHARGAAIDLDADDNGNLVHWPTVADMPIEVMMAFAREGWVAAGAFWGRDGMHFQATQ